jgi:hypothetical protein
MENEIQIIKIADCKLELTKDFISDTKKVETFTKELDGLGKIILDLSTPEKIKQAEGLRKEATKFVKDLTEFCAPYEAEGKRIQDARSDISRRLNKSKSSVIDALLAPIDERKKKLVAIKDKLFIPSSDIDSCNTKLADLKALDKYDWLGFKDEALPIIQQCKTFFENELLGFEKAAKEKAERIKAELETERLEYEQIVADRAAAKAEADAQVKIDEANKRAEVAEAKIIPVVEIKEASKLVSVNLTEVHQGKIHREILADLDFYIGDVELRKSIIKAIVVGKIRNLKITY